MLAITAAFGCGDPPPSEYPSQPIEVEGNTTLGPGDVFAVRVYNQDEMSDDYAVSGDGTISFPLIGVVAVTGKTPSQLEVELRERLADGFFKNPQVSVLVKEYNSKKVSVFGQVRRPGTLPFGDGMTIVEAISQAGGFTGMARRNAVTVTRDEAEGQKKYTVPVERIGKGSAANFYLVPGDVVFVPERWY